jgi:CBS domain containing-hemolysin-like protein
MELSLGENLWRLAAVLALVLANGFFVAAEFSIVTVRKTRVDQLIAEGHRGARAVRRAVSAPDRFIAATQLGITMASLGLGWMAEPALASIFEPALTFLPLPIAATTSHSIAVAVAFAIVTALHIVLGSSPQDHRPRQGRSDRAHRGQATELFMKAFWPFIRVLNRTGRRWCGCSASRPTAATRWCTRRRSEDARDREPGSGVLEEHEEQMLHRVFGFADRRPGR